MELTEGGVMLGIVDDFAYEEGRVTLDPGDLLLIYSDGLTDAVNASEEPLGLDPVLPRSSTR